MWKEAVFWQQPRGYWGDQVKNYQGDVVMTSECKFEMENYRVHCENWPVQIFRVRQPPG